MGNIIKFPTEIDAKNRKTKEKFSKVIAAIATICTITGISLISLITLITEKDWQAIAEQYNAEALELYDLGEYEQAIELYDKAIDLEPKGINNIETCYFNRGRAYDKLGNYKKAIHDYTKAIEICPKSKYYSTRAVAYEKSGDTANAALDNLRALTTITE